MKLSVNSLYNTNPLIRIFSNRTVKPLSLYTIYNILLLSTTLKELENVFHLVKVLLILGSMESILRILSALRIFLLYHSDSN